MTNSSKPKRIYTFVGPEPTIRQYGYHNGGGEYLQYQKVSVYIESSIDDLVEKFNQVKENYPNFETISIESANDCGCYHDCSCSPSYYFKGYRMEYPVETKFREDQEKQREAARLEQERREFERLKAKFGE